MGEHSSDKPYDVICDEIIAEQARKQAEKEAAEWRKGQVQNVCQLTESLTLHTQKERGETWKENTENKITPKEETKIVEEIKKNEENEKKSAVMKSQKNEKEKLEERTMEIYMNWKEAQEVKQKMEKEDSEWQETLRKSKAADERRRSMAKQARDDYKRLSMQAIERGSVANRAKNFGGEFKRPPLPPKPSNCGINRTERRHCVRKIKF
ncbi:unnamed protein product [Staurois parvus]|uniref:Uncharacterized protein n=1 Tax=Staurois parvus TaxID=386267 RepID=A0ABN9DSV0_9NEOB|nr:unnamed protein product [Staurois parvus]